MMTTSPAFRISTLGLIAAIAATVAATASLAAPPPNPKAAIAARQAGYKKMGAAMKTLNDQLKTDAPPKAVLVSAAQTLATTAKGQPSLFPAGSGPGAGVDTDALPNIWTERADFDAQMSKLLAETGKLATVASSGNLDALRAQARATGAVCKGCHTKFRADD